MGKIAKKTMKVHKIKKPKVKTMKPTKKLLGKVKRFDKINTNSNLSSEIEEEEESLHEEESEIAKNSPESEDMEQNDEDLPAEDEVHNHQQALERLKDTDPEFYAFLAENDQKLLNFNVSDDDTSASDFEDEVHLPTAQLEVASDESDYEGDVKTKYKRITLKQIKSWQVELQQSEIKSNATIINVVKAFAAALRSINPNQDGGSDGGYRVEGSAVFNATIQLCVLYLGPAVRSFLHLHGGKRHQPPHKAKKFIKIKTALAGYFADLAKLLQAVSSGNILIVLLKHLHYMAPLLVSFPHVTKPLLKRLVTLWGSSPNEPVRVLSFLIIVRIVNQQKDVYLNQVLKMMYMSYVKNSKFISVNTMPTVNFMRRSLVELFALDLSASYQHVFMYIRQLAINLRNAIVDNRKENIQVVYNWQYVNSCRLWGTLLGQTCSNKPQLQALIYPFVQVCIGCLKLLPTAAYYPLRFHIVQVLMDLSKDTGVYVPVTPFLTEVLTTFDFNKKHLKVSMKPLCFTTALRMGKAQMTENGFKDAIVEAVYGGLLEHLTTYSHSIAFPDMAIFVKLQIKLFLKKCTVASYNRKMSQLLEKIEQNCAHIETARKRLTVALTERKKIEAWEAGIKNAGTPLTIYFENWDKVRNIRKGKLATGNEEIGDYNLPVLKRKPKSTIAPTADACENGKVVLFPSDSEDTEVEQEAVVEKPKKRGKRSGKNAKKQQNTTQNDYTIEHNDAVDIVEDITDW